MQTLFCWPEEKLSWYCELVSKKPHIQPIRSNICSHLELCKCPWWIKSNIHSMFSTVLLFTDSWGNLSGSGLLFGAEKVVFSRLLELCRRLLLVKTTLMRVAGVNQYVSDWNTKTMSRKMLKRREELRRTAESGGISLWVHHSERRLYK